jgi:hypothetical protein
MKTLLAIFLATLFATTSHGQTVKALSYNVTNSTVIWTNTNALKLTNQITVGGEYNTRFGADSGNEDFFAITDDNAGLLVRFGGGTIMFHQAFEFVDDGVASTSRSALGLSWPALVNTNAATALLGYDTNGAVVYTNTNALTFVAPISVRGAQSASTVTISDTSLIWESVERINLEEMIFYGLGGAQALELSFENGPNISYYPLDFGGTNAALHAAQTRTNLGLGATNDVTFRNVSVIETDIKLATTMEDEGAAVFIQRGTNESVFLLNLGFTNNTIQALVPIGFNNNTTNAGITRTNLGLPLAALTNDSNVTLMRALSGSTNTNHPFSGSISVVGTNNTNTLVFSNGILQSVQ